MGGMSSNKVYLNEIIYLDLKDVNCKSLNEIFLECISIMREVEEIRRLFSVRWNTLCVNSGAIVLQKPNFNSILLGILWKIAAVNKIEEDKAFTLDLFAPFLEIKDESDSEIRELKNAYRSFMEYFWEKYEIMKDLLKNLNNVYERVIEKYEKLSRIEKNELDK